MANFGLLSIQILLCFGNAARRNPFKIWKADVIHDKWGLPAGTVAEVSAEGIAVCAGEGALLIREVQSPGKKRMKCEDWLKGNSIEIHTVLG